MKKYATIPLGYFFIVSLLGLLLRFFFVTPIPFNFEHLLHAHSHVALLGWLYLGMTLLIYRVFLKGTAKPKLHRSIFIVHNVCFLGMLIAFPIQGYALYSIAFSCLYLLSSYWFTWFIVHSVQPKEKKRFSYKLIKTALFFLVISSLGTWAVGPISATVGTHSFWFNDALYFFLHFLYSGFFFLSLISVLFRILENKKLQFKQEKTDQLYVYLNLGVILSYFLSVLWTKPPVVFYVLGIAGALFQIRGYLLLFKLLCPLINKLKSIFGKFGYGLIKMAGALLIIRVLMQLGSGIPYFAELAFKFRDFIIGYLHMVFLGIITPILWLFFRHFKMIQLPQRSVQLFLFTFFATEALIFYHAVAFWLKLPLFPSYYQTLAALSCLFPLALGWLWICNLKDAYR